MNHIDHPKPTCLPTAGNTWPTVKIALAPLRTAASLALLIAILANGCLPPDWPEYIKDRQNEEKNLTNTKHQLVNKHSDVDTRRNYLQAKVAVMEKEKRANEEFLFTARGNIRSIFQNLKKTVEVASSLPDCYLGDEVIERQNISMDTGLLLVDLGNPALFDMTLVAGAIYSESSAAVTFCTIGAVPDKQGAYQVLSVGQEGVNFEAKDNTPIQFDGRYALRIKAGEYVGLYIPAGTQMHYDIAGTGKTFAVSMDAPPKRNIQFELDPNAAPTIGENTAVDDNKKPLDYNRAYSFRLWGFKR